jgi:UPF0755 protein
MISVIKKLLIIGVVLLAVAAGGFQYSKQQMAHFLAQPMDIVSNTLVVIPKGSTLNSTLAIFAEHNWINSSPFSRLIPRFHPELVNVKVGTFELVPGDTVQSALDKVIAGKEYQFSITFIEGSRFEEWLTTINQAPGLTHKLAGMTEQEIAKLLGIDQPNVDQPKLEGQFLAETYHYTDGMSDVQILKRAHSQLMSVLNSAWEKRDPALPLKTSYEALIMASIIEKETALESERKRVASVFINRLNKKMRLQTDPTVIYGLGEKYDGNIRKKDLTTATPYNTYVIDGLPPTPIATAGRASIEAALAPDETTYLYFVASGHGGHIFSDTLAEHNKAVRNYINKMRQK